MRRTLLGSAICVSALSAALLSPALLSAQPREEVITEVLDVPYRTTGDEYALQQGKLDLHLPKGKTNFPVLIYFHGGGLTSGDKASDTSRGIALAMAREGIATASVNYRLSPNATFPAYIEDAAAGTAWVKNNIAEHGGNPNAVFIAGHSAGGYLAAMVGTAPQYLAAHGIKVTDFAGVIPMSAQMTTHGTVRRERGIEGQERVVDEAAGLYYAKKDLAPILIIVGGNDNAGTEETNREYVKTLIDAGHLDVSLFIADGRSHNEVTNWITQPGDEVGKVMAGFVRAHLPKE